MQFVFAKVVLQIHCSCDMNNMKILFIFILFSDAVSNSKFDWWTSVDKHE